MTSSRLKLSQEGLLCRTAVAHFGVTDLHHLVIALWKKSRPLCRNTVEYLDIRLVGEDVLDILRIC